MHKNLSEWLRYIENLHTKPIVMGLDRVEKLIERLELKTTFHIISVAGTNGKGSTCAMLEAIYVQAGYRVGCYTSPHLLRYNERVRVNGQQASDNELCQAFAVIESARLVEEKDPIALTYFEIGTLAAIWHFLQFDIDIAILEIGLGGRLDAVNAFKPDCAIVTSIDLDHQDFLGDTREKIGLEKSGVFRQGVPAICGDKNPPKSLMRYAKQIQADLKMIQHDFDGQFYRDGWQYLSNNHELYTLPLPALKGDYQLSNAACAVTAVESLQFALPVHIDAIAAALLNVKLAGRFQLITQYPQVILDVAHNPHAAQAFATNLMTSRMSSRGKVFAVFAILSDKDIKGVVDAVKNEIDVWYIASIHHTRGALAHDVALLVSELLSDAKIKTFNFIEDAYLQACIDFEACLDRSENDKIVVFGSFFTVSSVMQLLENQSKPNLNA